MWENHKLQLLLDPILFLVVLRLFVEVGVECNLALQAQAGQAGAVLAALEIVPVDQELQVKEIMVRLLLPFPTPQVAAAVVLVALEVFQPQALVLHHLYLAHQ